MPPTGEKCIVLENWEIYIKQMCLSPFKGFSRKWIMEIFTAKELHEKHSSYRK